MAPVVLLNQLSNAYKYVTNSGLSSRISPKYEEPICLKLTTGILGCTALAKNHRLSRESDAIGSELCSSVG